MEANKTELTEILKKHTKEEWRTLPSGGRELVVITNYDGAFEEYTNQLLLEKDKEIEVKSELAENYRRNLNRSQLDYLLEIDRHKNHIKILQSELNEKDKEIKKINKSADYWVKKHDEIILINSNLQSELNEYKEKANLYDKFCKKDKLRAIVGKPSKWVLKALMKENDELKEKRKEEIEKAYKDGRISMISSSSEVAFMTPEQYYTQTYGQ